ncbi:hypothetical protein RFM68_19260 [Mesorhizobium sp. MSK_1335]|uniref:DUF4169 family protein n=1 Tax=Mesorhizobium montanum TaxID=3072323 RepID=A0ABU4ZNP2_9HYPH|nr:hypothetical protein [Mesorhizobium sp. MSK_1335]MDX8526642.1 hypothetical protein [Mesorhizobium sp. MSK_1335]
MNDKANPPKKGDGERKGRLAEALRANLQKRKAQARSRRPDDADKQRTGDADKQRAGDADDRPEGLPAAGKMHKD